MKPKVRKLVVIVGASAALGVAGCGAASTASQQSPAGNSSAPSGAQAQPGPGGFDLSALATKLGVSERKLRAAMEKTRPSGTPGQAPGASGTDPATALANELGLSAAKVRTAMQSLRPAGANGAPPGSGAPPSSSTQSGTAA
jgi:hypothetical protein